MQRSLLRSIFGLAVLASAATFGTAGPAHAVSIGTLSVGTPFAAVIQSLGPSFSRDYTFHLDADTEVTLLASAQAQTSDHFGVSSLTISLFDATNALIATDSGVPLASFDSFDQTGISLADGDYMLSVFGTVPPTFKAFINVALVANDFVAPTPIPGAVLLLLTALGGLGGAGLLRKHRVGAQPMDLAA
jgi:hypothetical protein